ncbi:DUF3304 domain-containing protein [Collimonas pratensis]|uniref:DUF3304 domain-containing protein n=1 Tax=Collimonas pratensis TaxID=279113 RepID=UPI0009EDCD3D|nr:DUF3304 domain-containing protein [Collimonas pratensis]
MKKKIVQAVLLRWLMPLFLVLQMSACASAGSDSLAPEGQTPVPMSAVSHYGKGIGISEFSVNDKWGGVLYDGWGGGGSTVCCVDLPDASKQPLVVTVKWKTYRTNFKEERWHEATVPVHLAVPLGKSSGIVVHFMPGHRVEVWAARQYPESTEYPGPVYPRGVAPDYVPLPDEKPDPTKGK